MVAKAMLPWATLLLSLAMVLGADDENGTVAAPSLVLARKYISSSAITVEGKPLLMIYEVHNIADVAASDVTIQDEIDSTLFSLIRGEPSARLAELAPHSKHSHNITVVPIVSGVINVARAKIDYSIAGESKRMVSSSPGLLDITSAGAYLRATSYYIKEWFFFLLITLPFVIVPGLFYYKNKN